MINRGRASQMAGLAESLLSQQAAHHSGLRQPQEARGGPTLPQCWGKQPRRTTPPHAVNSTLRGHDSSSWCRKPWFTQSPHQNTSPHSGDPFCSAHCRVPRVRAGGRRGGGCCTRLWSQRPTSVSRGPFIQKSQQRLASWRGAWGCLCGTAGRWKWPGGGQPPGPAQLHPHLLCTMGWGLHSHLICIPASFSQPGPQKGFRAPQTTASPKHQKLSLNL